MGKTVMLCGIGEVGVWTLEFLARSDGVDRIVTFDINEEFGTHRTSLVVASSVFQGFTKKFEFRRNDLNQIDATAKLLDEIRPDVVFNNTTIQAPHLEELATFSRDVRDKLAPLGYGPWLPWNLVLVTKLMEAISKSGLQPHVVNMSFPDVVNPAIWKHFGFGPTVGAGNLDILAAMAIQHVSITEGVPVCDVNLYFVASHGFTFYGPRLGVPFFLKILVGDRDITHKYDVNQLLEQWVEALRLKARGGCVVYSHYGASAAKNIMAILRDTNEFTHAPSPNGLPGGYPVRLSAKGAEVILPNGLTLEQAIKINEDGAKFDGIESIENDGTIVYTDKNYVVMKELGYDCKRLPFDELESRSEELKVLYRRLVTGSTK